MGLALDHNGFLTVGEYVEAWKQYTRNFLWYPYTAYDHTVLVVGKDGIIEKQWKDLWPSQQVIRMRKQHIVTVGELNDEEMAAVAVWYHVLHTYTEGGEYVRMGKTDPAVQPLIEAWSWLQDFRGDLSVFSAAIQGELLPMVLFGVLLAHGSWTIKMLDGEWCLFPVKLTLPLTSSLFGKKDCVVALFDRLRALDLAHSVAYLQSAKFEYCQAVLYDHFLLLQRGFWLSTALSLANNSSSHYIRNVNLSALQPYLTEHGYVLPWWPIELQILPLD